MQIEFEAKFFVGIAEVQQKLQGLDAICVRSRSQMRRYVFDVPGKYDHWLRVRDEGEYITLTLKSFTPDAGIESIKELEVKVSDFNTTVAMLQELGYRQKLYVQNYREIWKLQDCLIMIDQWPALDPFIEIEGPSKASVHAVAIQLGFDMQHAIYGHVRLMYQDVYGISEQEFNEVTELTFESLPFWTKPSWAKK